MKQKLIRDSIPSIIKESGKDCSWRRAHGVDEHMVFLRMKMEEETREFFENPCYEEAADMVEVIKAFCHLSGLEWNTVLSKAENKQETHGGFFGGIILLSVE
jgi:predicted house-cleaning noncanonical NTP pyrophosphatase (MazG superfamily)